MNADTDTAPSASVFPAVTAGDSIWFIYDTEDGVRDSCGTVERPLFPVAYTTKERALAVLRADFAEFSKAGMILVDRMDGRGGEYGFSYSYRGWHPTDSRRTRWLVRGFIC